MRHFKRPDGTVFHKIDEAPAATFAKILAYCVEIDENGKPLGTEPPADLRPTPRRRRKAD